MNPADTTSPGPSAGVDAPFVYSEGEDIERYLHAVFSRAGDLSTGSQELVDHMRDWPTLYHLSPQRADLLRFVAPLLRGRILEVGSGCGAITRYLGETGAAIQGLEGSAARTALARLRCRDLPNVTIDAGNFETQAYAPQTFDVGILVGVLEYSRKYIQAADPVGFVLEKMRSLLTPDGVLVLAIENQLGLKYLAGAPEDHQGSPFFGLHQLYNEKTAVTFGKAELTAILHAAGFKHTRFLYPFPDYKLPHAVLTEQGARAPVRMVGEILQGMANSNGQGAYARMFSEEAAWPVIWRNGLVEDLANSFLVVASPRPVPEICPPERLATMYATRRRRPFCKQTHIDALPNKRRKKDAASSTPGVAITRERLYPQVTPSSQLRMTLCEAPPIDGTLLLTELTQFLNTPGWSVATLAQWAEPWLAHLQQHADSELMLPGHFLDCNPCNLIRRHTDGRLEAFDLEWDMGDTLPLHHVVLRGLGCALARHQSVAEPEPGTPVDVLRLCLDVLARLELRPDDTRIAAYFAFETEFQFAVYGRRETFFSGCTLQVRPSSWAAHLRAVEAQSEARARDRELVTAAFKMAPEVLRGILEPVFDAEFYGVKYPDVIAARVDPLGHYINYGAQEGRQPTPWFDAGYYLQLYPDVALLRMNPLAHYILFGKLQNRQCGPTPAKEVSGEAPAQNQEFRAVRMARRLAQSILPRGAAAD